MPEVPFGAGTPRPVADVPPAALADGRAPAKGWLLALIAACPLQDAPAVPTAELARDAPALCVAILRAVGSDAELPRLQVGGDLTSLAARTGTLAGAGSAASAVAAVGRLRTALWEALAATMAPLDAASTAALAQRLAFVCDLVAVASAAAGRDAGSERFHVYDARGDWQAAVERHVREGRAFALLALEVHDAQRLLAADGQGGRAAGALARVEAAVRAELRPGDAMAPEADGRLWVVAAELGASGARALAARVVDAVGAVAMLHGTPLRASIGLAASPADGTEVAALAARADETLFAARAAGVPIV